MSNAFVLNAPEITLGKYEVGEIIVCPIAA
jgi:phosphatidylserine decarboxylase